MVIKDNESVPRACSITECIQLLSQHVNQLRKSTNRMEYVVTKIKNKIQVNPKAKVTVSTQTEKPMEKTFKTVGIQTAEEQPAAIVLPSPRQPLKQPVPFLQPSLKRPSEQDRCSKRQHQEGMQLSSTSSYSDNDSTSTENDSSRSPSARKLSGLDEMNEASSEDVQPLTPAVEQARPLPRSRMICHPGSGGGDSESPLGSLDRTKVSLGCPVSFTEEQQRFIDNEWGVEGTMKKIMGMLLARPRVGPVTVQALMDRGPILIAAKAAIAARCLTSVFKLKHYGFLKIKQDPDTLEITDMALGPRSI